MTVEVKAPKTVTPEKKRLKVAEARKAEVELARLEIGLELDELRAQVTRDEHAWKEHADRKHGIFSLERSVGAGITDLAAEIRQWGRVNPGKPIILNIFSPGGSVFHGFVLYDTLRTLSKQGHVITTVTRGYAASMGSLIFLAGDVRIVGAESMLMFHHLATATGGMLYEIEEDLKFARRLNRRLFKIITTRTKISEELLASKCKKKDWWCTSEQAVKLGAAHRIG